jgi:hypothetical protein
VPLYVDLPDDQRPADLDIDSEEVGIAVCAHRGRKIALIEDDDHPGKLPLPVVDPGRDPASVSGRRLEEPECYYDAVQRTPY